MTLAHARLESNSSDGEMDGPPIAGVTASTPLAGPYPYDDIILLADILGDLERTRIANENRLRTLTRIDEWGKAVPETRLGFITDMIGQIQALEHGATLELKRSVRRSPLGQFQKDTVGLGEKTLGRLIGAIGDPAWHYADNRPRKLRELYAYCGLHVWETPTSDPSARNRVASPNVSDPTHRGVDRQSVSGEGREDSSDTHLGRASHVDAGVAQDSEGGDTQRVIENQGRGGVAPSRKRGERINWNNEAKTRCYLVAESMIKNRASAYRHVYDTGRLKYVDAVHQQECKRCGPSGKPAPAGSNLSDGHKHARAMRLVMKAFLKDLWQTANEGHTQ